MSEIPTINWHELASNAGGFSPQVFEFIREGLEHTSRTIHGPGGSSTGDAEDESRHVSGADLCLGLKDLAIERYGPLARTVLEHWNVHTTEDFGRLVFALIDAGILRKTDEDSYDDFVGVYDFEEAFGDVELI
ncbi:MAG: Minf_1886 family protein [Planctomycetota bacterium]